MNKDEIGGQLNPIFQHVFKNSDLIITREMTAADVETWDSLSHIQLITEVERAFRVKFKLREVMRMKNVGDLIDLIDVKRV